MTRAAATAIAVAIEVPHGPIVEARLERGFRGYAINPKQLDRFRDRFAVAGAKDDRRDALMSSATACAPTDTASGSCRPRMRPSSSCASGRE